MTREQEDDVIRVLRKAEALLIGAQWAGVGGSDATTWGVCPICKRADWKGHQNGCEFRTALLDIKHVLKDLVIGEEEA